ncbi:hypothetical protein GWI33_009194 [Rhynchophorus ferrugineus]|uniref:E3 ubiquitin-protein ligase listerin n=1 Tax=Rhynchophorus ferrugineus TaxID=354439 RepID=A0A834IFM2_RHYFE|nr:hypothetical protein GWI33_009194 [Rhynchophorus ferrugineus]
MGRKVNVANRTKNNAKPSSSGRSAAALTSTLPIGGFSGLKSSTGLLQFPFSTTEEFDSSLDEQFQLVLKKISKKDSTTKLKGLQEFAELVKKSDPDTVKNALPVWPRFFNVLATDTNNRVREATQIVHHEIVLKVKRNVAPYLKQIIAPWFTSQYDNYPPAATTATQAFKDTFSSTKFQDAIIFCQMEILKYIYDNLFIQTAQTVAGQNATPEEAEAKYERVLISCLQGYVLYLHQVPEQQIEDAMEANIKIVTNPLFWKMSKNKVILVRSAWFQVISTLCQKALFLLKNKEQQVLTVVLNSLDDGEPTVLPYVWETVLLIVTLIKEWWKYVNIEKLFIPKLMSVLKHGGRGNAVIIYPSMLPLISQLSPIEGNSLQFYTMIFDNMRLGLTQKLVIDSRSETTAIAKAFIECLQYIINKNLSNMHLCKCLISQQILVVLECCLVDDKSYYKPVFNQICLFAQYLGDHLELENKQILLSFFFESMCDMLSRLMHSGIKGSKSDILTLSKKEIELLHYLKQAPKHKNYKLKFDLAEEINKPPIEKGIATAGHHTGKYLENWNCLVMNICKHYVELTEMSQSKELLEELCSLIMDFDKEQFFKNLLHMIKKNNPNSQLIDIYNDILKKWLCSESLYGRGVVQLIFMLLMYLNKGEREQILAEMLDFDKPSLLAWSVSEALAFPLVELPEVKIWLQHDKIGTFFLDVVDKQIRDECPPNLSVIFKLALTENKDGELYMTKRVVCKIIEKLETILLQNRETVLNLDSCCSLAAYLCSIIYTESLLLTYSENLLLCLMKLSCTITGETEYISSDTLEEVNSAWQDSVDILLAGLPEQSRYDLIEKLTDVIGTQFISHDITDKTFIDHLTIIIVRLLQAAYKSLPLLTTSVVDGVFEKKSFATSGDAITLLCKVAEYIAGYVPCSTDRLEGEIPLTEMDILQHFVWSYLKYNTLSFNISYDEDLEDEDDEDDDISKSRKSPIFLLVTNNPDDIYLKTLYDYALGESFLIHFKNVKYYDQIFLYNTMLDGKLLETITMLDDHIISQLKSKLHENCLNHGWFWVKAAHIFYKKILQIDGFFHMKEIFQEDIVSLNGNIDNDFKDLEELRKNNISEFHFNDASAMSWQKVEQIIQSVRSCTVLIKQQAIPQNHWDFVVLSLVSWTSNCYKARNFLNQFQHQSMLVSVTQLYMAVCDRVMNFREEQCNENFVNEWDDVLLESIHADVALTWIYLAEWLCNSEHNTLFNIPLAQNYGKVTEYLKQEFLFRTSENLPKWSKFLRRGCDLLTSSSAILQLWGYRMLLVLVPGLIKVDSDALNLNRPHRKGLIFEQFEDKLKQVEDVVSSMLIEFRVAEDTCRVEPSYDSFTYTFAYLLLWDIMLALYEISVSELRYQYSEWLKNKDLLRRLLPNLLRLMPLEVLHCMDGKSKAVFNSFSNKPIDKNCYGMSCDSETVEQMVCYLYKSALAQLPALVRQWWSNLDTKVSQIVDKLTTIYVSPILCIEELNDVVHHQTKFKNMTIKVMPSIREILAVYTIDEAQMELTIALPANYPLGSPDINCNRQISGTTHKQWLLQFKKCVLHQNGRIWDGLSLWNNNLDRKFDGVEECYICYTVLHTGTYQLPRLSCGTCKKKFHSVCLYKWFSTSNKSSCPICRNLF